MKIYDIRDFGAIADGKTVNTEAIQKTIDVCAENGGGRVIVTEGKYVTGTIFMNSNVELSIEANGAIVASVDGNDYPDFSCEEWDTKKAPRATSKCLIYFGYIENASLTGMGMIDCQGIHYCDPVYDDEGKVVRYQRNTTNIPARMVFVMGCTNVRIEDITMKEMAGGWGYWINNSQFVTVYKAKLYCNPMYPNADGIHINCSSDIIVEGCVVHSGDDSIIIRSNTNTLKEKRVCERVVVKGCTLSSNHNAVRVAWRNDYIIRNCILSDLIITDTARGITMELPDHSNPTDFSDSHTVIENIQVTNVVLDRIRSAPLTIKVHPDNLMGRIGNIRFSNITSSSGDYPVIAGREDAVLDEIYFNNCKFTVKGEQKTAQFFSHVKGLHLTDTTFDVVEDDTPWKMYEKEISL